MVWCLAAHPAFSPSHHSMSADFQGQVRKALKQRLGDVVSIFLPGLAESLFPDVSLSLFLSGVCQNILSV